VGYRPIVTGPRRSDGGIFDVVIVGGGVMGSAIAYFTLADPAFDGRVVVIERDPTYQRASSALSASSIRQQFSTPDNIRISHFGIDFLRRVGEHLAVDGEVPDIGLVERGYLYLVTSEHETTLREIHAVQRAEGADVVLLTPEELGARYPWLDVTGIALASLGLSGEGWFDGYALTRAFRRKASSMGATFLANEAVGVAVREGRVVGVELDDGTTVACGALVNAAGPWAREVAAMAGVDLPVRAHRRTVFTFEARGGPRDAPLVIDTSGAWFRPEGEAFIGAIPPDQVDDLPDLPLDVDHRLWEERLWPALAARVPAFDALRRTGGWAGYYEMNTTDHNAIIGPHPEVANLVFASGFSGHGIQGAPAVGRAVAERLVHGRYVTLDLSTFGYERIAAGRRIVERNVIG
jgi:FAD-dependent oxidoreductase domain-containing protein 1